MRFREFETGGAADDARPCVVLRLGAPGQLSSLRARLEGQTAVAAVEPEEDDPACLWVVGGAGCDSNDFFTTVAAAIDWCNGEPTIGPGIELVETRIVAAVMEKQESPFVLSRRIWLAQPGHDQRVLPSNARIVLLTGGHVFGSGHHPSTRLAARAVDDLFAAGVPARVLDVGCGSGVLALACARLGASEVVGIDISPDARQSARHNVRLNRLEGRVRVDDRPLAGIDQRFDLIVANMTASVLLTLVDLFPARLAAEGGQLVLSGFHARQALELGRRLAGYGFAPQREYEEGGWRGLWLARR